MPQTSVSSNIGQFDDHGLAAKHVSAGAAAMPPPQFSVPAAYGGPGKPLPTAPAVYGGPATPAVYGGPATPAVYGGPPTPAVYGGPATPAVYGGPASPAVYGGAAAPTVYGGPPPAVYGGPGKPPPAAPPYMYPGANARYNAGQDNGNASFPSSHSAAPPRPAIGFSMGITSMNKQSNSGPVSSAVPTTGPATGGIADSNNDASAWSEHEAPTDRRKFWFNRITNVSTFDKPTCLKTPEERSIPPCSWKEYCTSDGKKYYSNGTATQ